MATVDDVRLLIPDLGDAPVFSNQQIESFLTLSGQKIFLAAALALEVIATDEALTYKIVRTDDLSVNGVTGADLLIQRAKGLRDTQTAQDTAAGEAFHLVFPEDPYPFPPEATPWPY